jgi:4-hydroxyphenylacetate 3-monooxygenase
LFLIRILTMQRTEYQVDGPLTELARGVLGLGSMDEIAARAAEAEQASHYASVRFQPEYAREQDQKKGYYIEDEKTPNLVSTAPAATN